MPADFHPGSRGNGCLFDGLFLHLNLHRIMADTDAENTAAWTLAERLGMRRDGHLHQSLWVKGRWADEYLYAILREEWLARGGASQPDSASGEPKQVIPGHTTFM